MDRDPSARFPCVVCGAEAHRHQRWFLVVENTWLDRVKILAWHPVLARQSSMQSVCGEQHLKTLLTHWLTHANLRYLSTGAPLWSVVDSDDSPDADSVTMSVGKFVGELAVHRESLSRVWTGSAQALECIVSALVEGIAERSQNPEYRRASQAAQSPAFAMQAGGAV